MMLRRQLPAYSPVSAWGIARATLQLLRSSDDPRADLRRFIERDFKAQSVTLFGSGTQALTAALRKALARGEPNAPIAVPAFSCFDVASAVVGAGALVAFYDVERDTLGPDPVSLERVLAAGARVVVTSPLYGMPQDWRSVTTLASAYNAVVLEDAAQSSGATLNGEKLGTLGDLSTLSFGRAKGWTGGSGGALLARANSTTAVDDVADPHFAEELADIGGMIGQYAFGRPYAYALPTAIPSLRLGQTTYRVPKSERSITRAAAAALLTTRDAAEKEAAIRKANAKLFLERIGDCPNVRTVSVLSGGAAGFLRLPLMLPEGMASFRSQRRARMLGIAPTYPEILPRLGQLAARRADSANFFPGASALVAQLVTLPTHSLLSRQDVDNIIRLLRSI